MNYNSKRLLNPLKPICRCKAAEFNTLVDVVRGSTTTQEHNKNLAFRRAIEELTSPCIDKNVLTLAEIVKVIPYIANETVNIYSDVFDWNNAVKPNGFLILVNANRIIVINSIYYFGDRYNMSSKIDDEKRQEVYNIRFPLTDKDITLIEEALTFTGISGDYTSIPEFKATQSGTIYMYKLNGTD